EYRRLPSFPTPTLFRSGDFRIVRKVLGPSRDVLGSPVREMRRHDHLLRLAARQDTLRRVDRDAFDPGVGRLADRHPETDPTSDRSEEHTSELQSHLNLV